MAELGEEVEIERGVAASLPSNGRKRRTLPPPWVEAKDRFPPGADLDGTQKEQRGRVDMAPSLVVRNGAP